MVVTIAITVFSFLMIIDQFVLENCFKEHPLLPPPLFSGASAGTHNKKKNNKKIEGFFSSFSLVRFRYANFILLLSSWNPSLLNISGNDYWYLWYKLAAILFQLKRDKQKEETTDGILHTIKLYFNLRLVCWRCVLGVWEPCIRNCRNEGETYAPTDPVIRLKCNLGRFHFKFISIRFDLFVGVYHVDHISRDRGQERDGLCLFALPSQYKLVI